MASSPLTSCQIDGETMEIVIDFISFILGFKMASQGKRSHWEVLRFKANLEDNVLKIQEKLINHAWYPGEYRSFTVFEPKERIIHAPPFADRVVHHALVQVIGEFFEQRFIDQSFACRKGKGTHAASAYLTHILRSATQKWKRVYVLKADISKYFPSINQDILLSIISRIIGDKEIRLVIERLVKHCSCTEEAKGLPLGALTSQLFANTYLDRLDHFLKDDLGVEYYVRYMDDFVLLNPSKAELWHIQAEIRDFLAMELRLTLNPKTSVFPANHGINFAGYRHWTDYTLPRKRNIRRAAKRFASLSEQYRAGQVELETVRSSMASFVGYIKHCQGWRSGGSALERLVLRPSVVEEPHKQ